MLERHHIPGLPQASRRWRDAVHAPAAVRKSSTAAPEPSSRGRKFGPGISSNGSLPHSRSQRTPLTPELKRLLQDNFGELPTLPKEEPPAAKPKPAKLQQSPPKRSKKPAATPGDSTPTRRRRPKPFAELMQSLQDDSSGNSSHDDEQQGWNKPQAQRQVEQQGHHEPQQPARRTRASSTASLAAGSNASGASSASQLQPASSATASSSTANSRTSRTSRSHPASPKFAPGDPAIASSSSSSSAAGTQAGKVFKGDLALPGGSNWAAFRRQVKPRAQDPELPAIDALVIVEGESDYGALCRAVSAPAYICDGTRLFQPFAEREVRALSRLGKQLIVLTDPDERGLEMRMHLEQLLGPLHHAFVPAPEATSTAANARHDEGNVGVEHAAPAVIRAALARVVRSFGEGRREFSMQDLAAAQLINLMEAPGVKNAAWKRQVFCGLFGVGPCNGKQLLRTLNRFATREHFKEVLARTEQEVQALGVEVGAAM